MSTDQGKETRLESFLQSFYSEFFGMFIPGFIAVGAVVTLGVVAAVYWDLIEGVHGLQQFFRKFKDSNALAIANSWLVFGMLAAVSYAVGVITYRRAPKVPDAVASFRQWMKTAPDGRKGLAVDYSTLPSNPGRNVLRLWPFTYGEQIQAKYGTLIDYPYPHLRRYLFSRGFSALAAFVPWCPRFHEKGSIDSRSKIQVNSIKQRILFDGDPTIARDLVRNESHIRLLSSLWYIFRFLCFVILVFIATLCLVHGLRLFGGKSFDFGFVEGKFREFESASKGHSFRTPFLVYSSSLLVLLFLKHNIEQCFNYVRTREIFMVLNAAEMLKQQSQNATTEDGWKKTFFEELGRRNKDFQEKFCAKCPDVSFCGKAESGAPETKQEPETGQGSAMTPHSTSEAAP